MSESATDAKRAGGLWWWWQRMHAAEHASPVSAEAVARICDCNLLALAICAYDLRAPRLAVTIPRAPPEQELLYPKLLCVQSFCTQSFCRQSFCRQRFCTCACVRARLSILYVHVCVPVCLLSKARVCLLSKARVLYLLGGINTQHSPVLPFFPLFPLFPPSQQLKRTCYLLLAAAHCYRR